ncbi:hypothetical protein EDD21DRAFT_16941 [Dissophora ornata]|nr:hypothetical protein EDD21DRAFT_16941 [Dissophora ornata]
MFLLAYLRKVILQDAATLMDLDDPDCDYSQHHIFRAPVFKTPHFMEFRNEFREAARNDMSPITEILAANAPAMHRELWSMNTRLTALDSKLETGLLRQLDQSMEHHQNVMSKSMVGAVLRGTMGVITEMSSIERNIRKKTNRRHVPLVNMIKYIFKYTVIQAEKRCRSSSRASTISRGRNHGHNCNRSHMSSNHSHGKVQRKRRA